MEIKLTAGDLDKYVLSAVGLNDQPNYFKEFKYNGINCTRWGSSFVFCSKAMS